MTQRHQDILFDVTGQTLVWDAPEGRPDSVTSVAVYLATTGDTGTAETATTGSGSVETNPDTTFDAAAGLGQSDETLMPIAATTGVTIGRSYLVTNAAGETEWPEIVAVTSGVSVNARNPLANAYASSDTLESTRISIALLDSWVQDSANISGGLDPNPGFRVRWVYVVNSVSYAHDGYFDLLRYPYSHQVKPAELDAMYPGFAHKLPTHHQEDEGRQIVAEAYQQIRWELHASDVDDSAVRNGDALNRAVMLKFGVILAEETGDLELLELRERRFNAFFDKIFRVANKVPLATDDSGAGAEVAALPLWSK